MIIVHNVYHLYVVIKSYNKVVYITHSFFLWNQAGKNKSRAWWKASRLPVTDVVARWALNRNGLRATASTTVSLRHKVFQVAMWQHFFKICTSFHASDINYSGALNVLFLFQTRNNKRSFLFIIYWYCFLYACSFLCLYSSKPKRSTDHILIFSDSSGEARALPCRRWC